MVLFLAYTAFYLSGTQVVIGRNIGFRQVLTYAAPGANLDQDVFTNFFLSCFCLKPDKAIALL